MSWERNRKVSVKAEGYLYEDQLPKVGGIALLREVESLKGAMKWGGNGVTIHVKKME